MTTDTIPHTAIRTLRQLAAPWRFRVVRDPEGWPMIPGRYGQIEWYCDGENGHRGPERGVLLAVWTDRPRLFATLWAIPGIRRWQTGAGEIRAVFPPEALEPVAAVIRARRRRAGSPEAALRMRQRALASATSAA